MSEDQDIPVVDIGGVVGVVPERPLPQAPPVSCGHEVLEDNNDA